MFLIISYAVYTFIGSYQIIMFLRDHLSSTIHVYTHTHRITMDVAKKIAAIKYTSINSLN